MIDHDLVMALLFSNAAIVAEMVLRRAVLLLTEEAGRLISTGYTGKPARPSSLIMMFI